MKQIYFDNAATTKVDEQVIKAMLPYFDDKFGNASSVHLKGQEAKNAMEKSRKTIAKSIRAHTQEIIGARKNIATKMNARSSMGRLGISVCKCAGFGDVGYISRWTMEITNHSQSAWIDLPVGMRIAQISFFRTGKVLNEYKGKYGQGEWTPEDMIPKLWKEKDDVIK